MRYKYEVNTSHMEEFDVIENYLRHGDYPIGIAKDQTCEENVEITASSTKASCIIGRKPTLHLCCTYDSSFNGRLSHELQVQIANIYRLAIKEKKSHGGRAASPAADCSTLTCGVIAIALTYHFSRGDSIEKFYFCTSILHMFATTMDQHENYSVTCAKSVLP